MSDKLHDLSTPALVQAIRANFYEFFRLIALSGSQPHVPGGVRWCTAVPHPWFRGVLVNQPYSPEHAGAIQDQIRYFKDQNVGEFSWWQDTSVPPGSWDRALEAQGFAATKGPPGMAMDLNTLPPKIQLSPDLQIRAIGEPEEMREYNRALTLGFEFPDSWEAPLLEFFTRPGVALPIRHYLGELSGEHAGTATLLLGAGVAGIYNIATLPEARRRGIGTALTLQPLYDARDLGYRVGILHADPDGYGVYEKIGFQQYCEMDHHIWAAENTE